MTELILFTITEVRKLASYLRLSNNPKGFYKWGCYDTPLIFKIIAIKKRMGALILLILVDLLFLWLSIELIKDDDRMRKK